MLSYLTYVDIDECVQNTDLCHHECINTIGSYVCDCNVGYMLEPNGLTCVGEYMHEANFKETMF